MNDLKIVCLGGGPAALYFSLLMKKANPGHDITVLERGPRDATWGFGVVFSDDTLRGFMEADAPSYKRIVEQFAYWDKIETRIHGTKVVSGGHGFCGMSRLKLLNALHDRCDELGVTLKFNTDIHRPGATGYRQTRPGGCRRRHYLHAAHCLRKGIRYQDGLAPKPLLLAGNDFAAGQFHLYLPQQRTRLVVGAWLPL